MNTFDNMIWENNFIEEGEAMPQTVPVGCRSPPSSCAGERAVPSSPADLQHLLRALGAASPPAHMLPSPPQHKPPPPYLDPTDQHYIDKFYDFECYPTPSPASDDSIPTLNFQPASPFNPHFTTIKEEPHRLALPEYTSPYPLSPSGSCVSYTSSPNNYSVSPAPHHDEYIDIEALLKENQILQDTVACQHTFITPKVEVDDTPRDHALLRTALEDTSFQKKFNLKPFPIDLGGVKMEESSGGSGTGGDALGVHEIDQVVSLVIEQTRKDVDNTCTVLGISPDPMQWSSADVKSWIMFTIQNYNLPPVPMEYFTMDGATLMSLTEEEFNQRAPQAGSTLYAQREIWKAARPEQWRGTPWQENQNPPAHTSSAPPPAPDDISDDEDSEGLGGSTAPSVGKAPKTGGTHIHLWQFLKELLASPHLHGSAIRWLDRSNGVFKIEDSVRVARLWGKRKNRPAMNYDKLSRSIRQYYKKGIMKKTERSQRLVYQFCHPYSL